MFGDVTWADLGTVLCLVLLILLVNAPCGRIPPPQNTADDCNRRAGQLQHHVFGALGKPLYVLIWVYGVYLAAMPLLLKLPPDEGLQVVRVLFDKLFDLGVFVAVFWLFFRFTHVLEARWKYGRKKPTAKLMICWCRCWAKVCGLFCRWSGLFLLCPFSVCRRNTRSFSAKATSILLIVAVAVILFQAVNLGEKAVLTRFDIKAADNLRARKIYTQVHVIGKMVYAAIGLFTVASILMLFQEVRQFGTSILASAGVVGIILGFAAQKTISNLFAGFQIAMTQPIRLDDVVIVEGEWGRVEEITLTYVIIHIWDDRRLIVPLGYFIEKPFQNWTRASAQLLGSVFLWVDYTMPLDELRKALKEIIEPNPLWDKRFWNLQVTDATEKTMQIRVLATTADSSKGWDLRCDIREKLIAYIQKHHPQSLPQFRAQIGGAGADFLSKP